MLKNPLVVMARMHSITKDKKLIGLKTRHGMGRFLVGDCICVMIDRGDAVHIHWPKKRNAPALTHLFDAYGS